MTAATADPLSGPRPQTHWPAPAKLNLFLHVIGRRADGYHELQTLFQLIDLCDTVVISVREDGQIERPVGPPGVPGETYVTVRGARASSVGRGPALRFACQLPVSRGSSVHVNIGI